MNKQDYTSIKKPSILWTAGIIISFLFSMGLVYQFLLDYQLEYIEHQAASQMKIAARMEGERIRSELNKLESRATFLQKSGVDYNIFLDAVAKEEGAKIGLLDLHGHQLYGPKMPDEIIGKLQQSFRGYSNVSFSPEHGIIFSVPVYHGPNVRYVFFACYEKEVMQDRLGISAFDGAARLMIATAYQQVVIPYDGLDSAEALYLKSAELAEDWLRIEEKLRTSPAAAAFADSAGRENVLLAAEIPGTEFWLCGYAPAELVAGEVLRLTRGVLIICTIVLIFLLACLAYALRAEQKSLQSEEFRRAKESAEAANRAKSAFLANMSHEIRTPINAIVGMNEMVLRESSEKTVLEYAANIERACKTLLSLVNDVLDFSKIEAGRMERFDNIYQTGQLLSDLRSMTENRAKAKGLELSFVVAPDTPESLIGDDRYLRQIVTNILTNAIKYTEKGKVTCDVRYEKKGAEGTLVIAVSDTGCGISVQDRERLFKNFERLEESKHRNIQGTGLGLAITWRLVKLLNGEITVNSTYGEGSTFCVRVPQGNSGREKIGDFEVRYQSYCLAARHRSVAFTAPKAHILVVDDNEMNLLVVKNLLKRTKIRVSTCLSGKACLELLAQQHFDMVMLDHMMPEMDGIETLQHAKQLGQDIAKTVFVMMTANAVRGVREEYIRAGFNDYLSKPIDSAQLEDLLFRRLPAEKISAPDSDENNIPENPTVTIEELKDAARPDEAVPAPGGSPEGLLNEATGLRYSANSKEMYLEFLKIFVELADEKSSRIKDLFTENNWTDYTVNVHALKGNALNIGAEKLSAAAKEIEQAGKKYQNDGDEKALALIKAKNEALLRLFAQTVQAVRKYLEEV